MHSVKSSERVAIVRGGRRRSVRGAPATERPVAGRHRLRSDCGGSGRRRSGRATGTGGESDSVGGERRAGGRGRRGEQEAGERSVRALAGEHSRRLLGRESHRSRQHARQCALLTTHHVLEEHVAHVLQINMNVLQSPTTEHAIGE